MYIYWTNDNNYDSDSCVWFDDRYVYIGSANALVLSGKKPYPEPMLTQIYVAIWHGVAWPQWAKEGIPGHREVDKGHQSSSSNKDRMACPITEIK